MAGSAPSTTREIGVLGERPLPCRNDCAYSIAFWRVSALTSAPIQIQIQRSAGRAMRYTSLEASIARVRGRPSTSERESFGLPWLSTCGERGESPW